MTDSFPWYKRDARAFYEGTRLLSLEARGAYGDIIDLIYIHNGALPDDPKWMSHALYVSVRRWKALRNELIEAGKIQCVDGKITNSRATFELEKRAFQRRVNAENGAKSHRKLSENSEKINDFNETEEISQPYTCAFLELEEEEEEKKEKEIEIKSDRSILSLDDLVEEVWAATEGRMMDDHDDPTALLRSWLKAGATNSDIVETVRAVAANKRHESIEHFGFFNKPVLEAASDRKAGRRNRNVPEKPMSAADWLAMKRAEAGLVDLGEAQAHGSA